VIRLGSWFQSSCQWPYTSQLGPAGVRVAQFCGPPALAVAVVIAYSASAASRPASADAPSALEGPAAAGPAPARQSGLAAEPAEVPDIGRYCQLSEQLGAVEDRYPDDPDAVADTASPQLVDMPRVAPAEIRSAVALAVDHIRADAGELTPHPDEAAVTRAEDAIDAFEEQHCP